MTELHDDAIYSLIRKSLPEIDDDTLSITGAQARAVLDRVITSDRLVVLDQDAAIGEGSDATRSHRGAKRRGRLVFIAPIGGAAAAVAAALLVVSLVGSPASPPQPTVGQSHGVTAVRAKLLAALDAVGGDVLQVDVPTGSGSAACMTTRWFAPFDVQPGGEFREHVEGHCLDASGGSESAVDITVQTVTPYILPTPASLAEQSHAGNVGVSVCGTGSFIGYRTTSATSAGTTWQASSEMLRVPAPATPDLLRSELSAGSLQLIGNTTVNGESAIELSVLVPRASQIGSTVSEAIWVDASTYLPIREVMDFQPKPIPADAPPGALPATGGEVVQNYTFLPPTPTNLALLQFAIPSGLTPVPSGQALTVPSCSSPFGGGPRTGNTGTTNPTGTTASAA